MTHACEATLLQFTGSMRMVPTPRPMRSLILPGRTASESQHGPSHCIVSLSALLAGFNCETRANTPTWTRNNALAPFCDG